MPVSHIKFTLKIENFILYSGSTWILDLLCQPLVHLKFSVFGRNSYSASNLEIIFRLLLWSPMESEPYDITLSYTSYTCGVGAQLLLFLKIL